MKRCLPALAVRALLVAGCSGTDPDVAQGDSATTTTADSATSTTAGATTTTVSVPATTSGSVPGSDRAAPIAAGVQVFEPAQCAAADLVLEKLAIPVTTDGDRAEEVDSALAAIAAAKATDSGFTTDVLALIEQGVNQERERLIESGFAGWQEALVERRSASDDEDLELQLENYRAYVTPRC